MNAAVVAGIISALALTQPAWAMGCLKSGEPVKGKFNWVDAKHPNGTLIHAPFLLLERSVCVKDSFGEASGTRMQLALRQPEGAKKIRPGTAITVLGDYGPPETAWHIGEIMAFNATISTPN